MLQSTGADPAPEPGDARAVALRWAQRTRKFPGKELHDMGAFAAELAEVALSPATLETGPKIGQGAFGTICRAELAGRGVVAVKYIDGAAGSSHALHDIMWKARSELQARMAASGNGLSAGLGVSAGLPVPKGLRWRRMRPAVRARSAARTLSTAPPLRITWGYVC